MAFVSANLHTSRYGDICPQFKFEFFALALTGSIRPELMAEGSSDPTLRAGPQFLRCLSILRSPAVAGLQGESILAFSLEESQPLVGILHLDHLRLLISHNVNSLKPKKPSSVG